MNSFSSDVDILRYEPCLFGGLYSKGQVLASGIGGQLSGTSFTAADEEFYSAGVSVGSVIYLSSDDGLIDSAFEVISVDSATQLTVSVVRTDSADEAVSPGDCDELSYRVCTYQPQSNEVLFQLTQHFGLRPGVADSDYDADDILDTEVLRQASVYGTLALVFATLAWSESGTEQGFWAKHKYYRNLFEESRQRCKVNIDSGGDGVSDSVRSGASIRLRRD